jgi:hypothetical protein
MGSLAIVDKVALGKVFSEYFGFPCQSSFHQLLHNHPHLSSGAGTISQKWSQYKGLSPTQLAIKKSSSKLIILLEVIYSSIRYHIGGKAKLKESSGKTKV